MDCYTKNTSNFLARTIFILIIMVIIPFRSLYSQGYVDAYEPFWYLKGTGAQATSLSYNTTAHSTGINDIVSNPALLGEAEKFKGSISLLADNFHQNARLGSSSNSFNHENSNISGLDNIGLVYPVAVYRGSFVLGLSYTNRAIYNYVSRSSTREYNYDYGYGYLTEDIEESGRLHSLNLGGALEIDKNFFVGLSLHLYNGYRDYHFTGKDEDKKDQYSNEYYDDLIIEENIETDYSGWNFSIGTLYKGGNFKWGLQLKSPMTLNAKENSVIDTSMIWSDGFRFDTTLTFKGIEYETSFPLQISTGIAFDIGNITMAMDLAIKNWNDINFNSDLEDVQGNSIDNKVEDDIGSYLTKTTNYGLSLIIPLNYQSNINAGFRSIGKPNEDLDNKYARLRLYSIGLDYDINDNFMLGISYQLADGNNNISQYFDTQKEENYRNHRLTISTDIIFGKN
ncbi:MAG: hypothetical protein K9M80_06665 [Candidatus Marinimicrobia bacterium]|nr:hypothetical protein [Candidatus Neomarinimicrobiota bacterium]